MIIDNDMTSDLMQVLINQHWLSYAIGAVGMLFEWRAYFLPCGLAFRRWSAWAALLWASQYFLLNAWTAGFTMACTALRTLLSGRLENARHKHSLAIGFVLIFMALTSVSWQGFISLLPAFAVINTTLALFYCHNRTMRIALLASSLAWIANDIYWQAWMALITETTVVFINIRTLRMLDSRLG